MHSFAWVPKVIRQVESLIVGANNPVPNIWAGLDPFIEQDQAVEMIFRRDSGHFCLALQEHHAGLEGFRSSACC